MSDPVTGTQALLASLSFGLPRQSRKLEKEPRDIEEQAHAQEGVVTGSVFYFKQKNGKETIDALSELKSYHGLWKKEHERLAKIPWMGSTRLLPAAFVPQYAEMRARFEAGITAVVAEFFTVYEDWRVTAPHRMGSLFDPDDFPSESECRERINVETNLMPLADGQSWQRIALINPNHVATEENRYNDGVARAREEGRLDFWKDLLGRFQHITDVLSKDKVRIHATLIGGLTDLLDMVPAYGPLFNDENLIRCATEARTLLGSITAEDLRADPALRQQAVANARELTARFGALGARRFA
jgi:hypothetical protein